MPKVLGYERYGSSHHIHINDGESEHLWLLRDGNLEAYMESYGLMPGEAFALILLDICDESVEVPPYLQPGMREIVEQILMNADTIEWAEDLDRDEVLASITVTADSAPELSATWREQRIREESAVAGYQRRQEELLAAEFVDSMPSVLRSLPKSSEPMRADDSLQLAIKYVP